MAKKYAKLTDWKDCGFDSRDDMRDKIAQCVTTKRADRARFKTDVLSGPRRRLALRVAQFLARGKTTSPYRVEGPAVLGVSGGRTSAYMLRRVMDAHGGALPDDVLAIFQNTGKERDETLDFLHELETRWGVNLVWLEFVPPAPGEPPRKATFRVVDYHTAYRDSWPNEARVNGEPRVRPFNAMLRMFRDYRATKGLGPILPNPVQRMCTANLKMKTQERYLKHRGVTDYDAVAGIRYDEPRRVANAKLSLASETVEPVFPLAEDGVTEDDVMAYWASQPFDLNLRQGEGNCDLCFLKSVPKTLALLHRYPERAQWWIDAEEEAGDHFNRRWKGKMLPNATGYEFMLQRARAMTEEQIEELRCSGVYPDSLPCTCTD